MGHPQRAACAGSNPVHRVGRGGGRYRQRLTRVPTAAIQLLIVSARPSHYE